ncbi:hypothetical protein B7486_01985 [cyanobacterium TDX16]|nr:hypothetical protein B7486_01985 [cyanobacterium TDX16]
MAMVLVIVGFVVGARVVGGDLVQSGRIHRQIMKIKQYRTAINAFRANYGAMLGAIRTRETGEA